MVQLVIAAKHTSPWLSFNLFFLNFFSSFVRVFINAFFAFLRGTLSCGLLGPARELSIEFSSISSKLLYLISLLVFEYQVPWIFEYFSIKDNNSFFLPVRFKYLIVSSSIGNIPHVAPYSGAILEIVDLSDRDKLFNPGPKNSTNFPTTPYLLSFSVMLSTKSVAVTPSGRLPESLTPKTSGICIETDWPSITDSASIPPTPQPSTDNALTIVVWLSVPTTVSKKISLWFFVTTSEIYSKLIWWQIPAPGGKTLKFSKDICAHFSNLYLSWFLLNSLNTFSFIENLLP